MQINVFMVIIFLSGVQKLDLTVVENFLLKANLSKY